MMRIHWSTDMTSLNKLSYNLCVSLTSVAGLSITILITALFYLLILMSRSLSLTDLFLKNKLYVLKIQSAPWLLFTAVVCYFRSPTSTALITRCVIKNAHLSPPSASSSLSGINTSVMFKPFLAKEESPEGNFICDVPFVSAAWMSEFMVPITGSVNPMFCSPELFLCSIEFIWKNTSHNNKVWICW